MQVIYERSCGLDVHKKTVVACVVITLPDGGAAQAGAHLCHHHSQSAGPGGLVSHLPGQPCGNGK